MLQVRCCTEHQRFVQGVCSHSEHEKLDFEMIDASGAASEPGHDAPNTVSAW